MGIQLLVRGVGCDALQSRVLRPALPLSLCGRACVCALYRAALRADAAARQAWARWWGRRLGGCCRGRARRAGCSQAQRRARAQMRRCATCPICCPAPPAPLSAPSRGCWRGACRRRWRRARPPGRRKQTAPRRRSRLRWRSKAANTSRSAQTRRRVTWRRCCRSAAPTARTLSCFRWLMRSTTQRALRPLRSRSCRRRQPMQRLVASAGTATSSACSPCSATVRRCLALELAARLVFLIVAGSHCSPVRIHVHRAG